MDNVTWVLLQISFPAFFSSAFRSLFSALTRSCSIAVSLPTRSDHFSFSFTFNFAFNPRDLYSRGYKNNYYNNNNHHHHNHNTAFGQWHNNLITKADKPRNPLAAAPSFSPQKIRYFCVLSKALKYRHFVLPEMGKTHVLQSGILKTHKNFCFVKKGKGTEREKEMP